MDRFFYHTKKSGLEVRNFLNCSNLFKWRYWKSTEFFWWGGTEFLGNTKKVLIFGRPVPLDTLRDNTGINTPIERQKSVMDFSKFFASQLFANPPDLAVKARLEAHRVGRELFQSARKNSTISVTEALKHFSTRHPSTCRSLFFKIRVDFLTFYPASDAIRTVGAD